LGNCVHHFDIPGEHDHIFLVAEARVEMDPAPPLPAALSYDAWQSLPILARDSRFWDMLQASALTRPTPALAALADELHLDGRADPLATLLDLNRALYAAFRYAPQNTRIDSTIDEVIAHRQGVCQDFTRIMIALVRQLGIPCRYLFHRQEDSDRSEGNASHAWAEAFLPGLGWIGLDPTNNLLAGERHIRVAVGRDYADVPLTRGVFKGLAASELGVSVRVSPDPIPLNPDEQVLLNTLASPPPRSGRRAQQQQQQQQQ
jgi:transglutaminase-like putative cysteine protease